MQGSASGAALGTPEGLELYPGSSCMCCNRSHRGCHWLLQNGANPSFAHPGWSGTQCSILSWPARLAEPRQKTENKQFNFLKNLLQIRVILSTVILIEMGIERAQHISGSRSKYRNCIFVLVMCLVFSQPQQFFMFIKNRCSFDLDFFPYFPELGSCRSEHSVTMTERKYNAVSKYYQIIPGNIQHQYWL